jgi:GxxExxY protein
MAKMVHEEITYIIIGAAMEVHKVLGNGFLEAVYQKALEHELRLRNIPFEAQVHLPVYYKGELVGDYIADFLIDGRIVVEIKAVSSMNDAHLAQTIHYLTATNNQVGLLINVGAKSLEHRCVANTKSA